MNLRDTMRKIISQLEEKSGYPVQVVEDVNLPVFASLKVAYTCEMTIPKLPDMSNVK